MVYRQILVDRAVKLGGNIVIKEDIMGGTPVIKNTRIPVFVILDYLAGGLTVNEIVEEFPHLTEEDISNALLFASAIADVEDK
ncbi:MAG: DUF433 domain-containing protein [Peptococcaceae bacterium]|nr:DUF433 domain-containing protein [Peptococcaceae bacterium]